MFRFAFAVLLVVGLWLLPACNHSNKVFQPLVGEWRVEKMEFAKNADASMQNVAKALPNKSRIVYKADSTYNAEMLDQLAGGRWYLDSNNTVLVTITGQHVTNRMKIVQLEPEHIVLHNITGDLDYTLSMVPYNPKGKKP